jgi:hypothetical protein
LEEINGILSDEGTLHSRDPDGAAFAVEHWGALLGEVKGGAHDQLFFLPFTGATVLTRTIFWMRASNTLTDLPYSTSVSVSSSLH